MEQDECWFSRFKQPRLHGWTKSDQPLRLVQRTPASDQKPKALACFGAVCQNTARKYFYLGPGQPNTDTTVLMLKQLLALARDEGKRVLLLFWDQASWHKSQKLRRWLSNHNQTAKQTGDVRLLTYLLPRQSPWLNAMEPHWIHAKRTVAELEGQLSMAMLKRRLCAHFQVSLIEAQLT